MLRLLNLYLIVDNLNLWPHVPGGLCDPIWHVISRSGEVISTNCYICTLFRMGNCEQVSK